MGEGLLRSSCATGSADARVAQVAAKRVVKCIVAECVLSVCMCVCLIVLLLSLSRVNLCNVVVVMISPYHLVPRTLLIYRSYVVF